MRQLEPVRELILRRIRDRVPLAEAVAGTDLTVQALHGIAQWNAPWSAELDAALLLGRDPAIRHGEEQSYRHFGCRCPDCRRAHNETRGPRAAL